MKSLLIYCFLALLLNARSCPAQGKPTVPSYPSRSAFIARMAKVQRGMTKEQVTALLGKPDVIHEGMGGVSAWLYGVTPKSGCPSLGTVDFDEDKKVRSGGSERKPPPESLISEATLRDLLDVIWGMDPQSTGIDSGYFFDPLTCIKAVNTLQKYRKEQVLAVTDEYIRICASSQSFVHMESILLLLRVLFDPPDRHSFLPEIYDGLQFPPWPANKARIPRYPLIIVEDVPFCLIYGGPSGSWMSSTGDYLPQFFAYLKKHAQLRKSPLHPRSDPLEILDRFASSEQWLFGKDYPINDLQYDRDLKNEEKTGRLIIRLQLLRLVRTVLPLTSPFRAYVNDFDHVGSIKLEDWPQIRAELSKLSFHWNAELNEYQLN